MEAKAFRWSEVESDNPIPLLMRNRIQGEQMLIAKVHLTKGCQVALHQHVSEQAALVLNGHVRWTLGEEGDPQRKSFEMKGGEVLMLPSNVWHGIEALEDSVLIDVLSPPGAMGVDSQKS